MVRILMLVMALLMPQAVGAEWYAGGQLGGLFPSTLDQVDIQGTGLPAGSRLSEVDLSNSFVFGAKAGYYFEQRGWEWLGLETEVFHANPDISSQSIKTSLPPGFIFVAPPSCAGQASCSLATDGADLSVTTWAPLVLKARYQRGPWQPYVGVGLGLFFASTNALGPSMSTTAPGLVTQVGLEYKLTDRLGLFGEWKYNRADLSFSGSGSRVDATYKANALMVGVTFHLPQ